LNTITLYSLPTLSSFVSETEEEEMEKFPDKVSRLLGHFSCRNCKQSIKRLSKRRHSITKTGMRCYHGIVLQYTLQQGQPPPPPSLSIQWKGSASRGGRGIVNESSNSSESLIALCHIQLYQKDEASFYKRRLVTVNVEKVALCSKLYYLI